MINRYKNKFGAAIARGPEDEFRPTPEMDLLLRKSGSHVKDVSLEATHELAKAAEIPLRQGVLYGNIIEGIFQAIDFPPGTIIEFPLDFLAPGTEKNYVAYIMPNHGRIPERHTEGDILTVNTYMIASSIDWLLKYARDARWDIISREIQVLEASFIKKLNDDGFHTLLRAGVDRNILVYDSAAAPGTFTKRLISLLQQVIRRNAGGNTASLYRAKLTDIFMSLEMLEDVRNWSTADVDQFTLRQIFTSPEGDLRNIFNINLHDLDEFGFNQQYQNYYTNDLAGTLAAGDQELLLGLDLAEGPGGNGTFIMPIRERLQIFEDDNLHRQQRAGLYGWQEQGFAVLDNRRIALASA